MNMDDAMNEVPGLAGTPLQWVRENTRIAAKGLSVEFRIREVAEAIAKDRGFAQDAGVAILIGLFEDWMAAVQQGDRPEPRLTAALGRMNGRQAPQAP